MAQSQSGKQLLGPDKLKDPYYALIWSNDIYYIVQDEHPYTDPNPVPKGMPWGEFQGSQAHKENNQAFGANLDNIYGIYKQIVNSSFKVTRLSDNTPVEDVEAMLEVEFDNDFSVDENVPMPELVKIQQDTWDEIEQKHKNKEIDVPSWNDVAYLLSMDRFVEYFKARYTVEFAPDITLFLGYLAKNKDYQLPTRKTTETT